MSLARVLHIKAANPYAELKNDPYAHSEIFRRNLDFRLDLVEESPNQNVLLFRKVFNDETAEYAFIACRDKEITFKEFQEVYTLYRGHVKKFGQGDFKEVEPVLIARGFSYEVIKFIGTYNEKHSKRKPFRLFSFSY